MGKVHIKKNGDNSLDWGISIQTIVQTFIILLTLFSFVIALKANNDTLHAIHDIELKYLQEHVNCLEIDLLSIDIENIQAHEKIMKQIANIHDAVIRLQN